MKHELTHGGDWAGFLSNRGYLPLDYSSNISPLGVPPVVHEAMRKTSAKADRYPDTLNRELKKALSRKEK